MAVTQFVAEKDATISMLLNTLRLQGYRGSSRRKKLFARKIGQTIGGKTTWSPDIFSVSRTRGSLAADVQLFEPEHGQFVPDIVEKAARAINDSFGRRIKVALFVPLGSTFSPPEIIKAVNLKLSIHAFDHNGQIFSLLDPSVSCFTQPTTNEITLIKNQIDPSWIIPKVLVSQLPGLRRIEYASCLREFAESFSSFTGPITLEKQYDIAAECIQNILNEKQLVNCCSSVRVEQGLEQIARIGGKARDHFVHQFQTFLIGSLIIEKYNNPALSPFRLSTSYPRIDIPWLLASIFHDYGSTISDIESCINTGIGRFDFRPASNLTNATYLNSFYEYLVHQTDPDNWDPETYQVHSTNLQTILFNAIAITSGSPYGSAKPNHGVISSHKILELSRPVLVTRPNLKPVFFSSALSAAMHDKALWYNFFFKSVFPLDARKFPITYLLVLCDTIAEAGRPKTTETSPMDALIGFDVQQTDVNCTVWFRKTERSYLMNFWNKFVQERCFVNGFLNLNCKCIAGEIT